MSVATDAVELLGEYTVGARLPLTDRIGYAIGVWDDEPVVSVSLTRATEPSRRTAGLLLATPGTPIRWAFEIGSAVGLIEIASVSKPAPTGTRWLRTATLAEGRSIQFVDVAAMIDELAGIVGARAA